MLSTIDRIHPVLANDADDITAFFAEPDELTIDEILAALT